MYKDLLIFRLSLDSRAQQWFSSTDLFDGILSLESKFILPVVICWWRALFCDWRQYVMVQCNKKFIGRKALRIVGKHVDRLPSWQMEYNELSLKGTRINSKNLVDRAQRAGRLFPSQERLTITNIPKRDETVSAIGLEHYWMTSGVDDIHTIHVVLPSLIEPRRARTFKT